MTALLSSRKASNSIQIQGFARQKERVDSSSVADRIKPRSLPSIQANIRTNGTVRTVELAPIKPSSTTPGARSPSMVDRESNVKAMGLTQKSKSVTVGTSRLRTSSQIPRQSLSVRLALRGLDGGNPMIAGGIMNDQDYRFMLGGLIDGFTGRQTFLESALQYSVRERGAYKWGYGISDTVRLATGQTVRDLEQQRRRLWENRPTFEIPQIKLPRIEFPEIKLPEIKLPELKLPELPEIDIRLPELKPIPLPPKINIRKPEKTELEKIKEINTPDCGGYFFEGGWVFYHFAPPTYDREGNVTINSRRSTIKEFINVRNNGQPDPFNRSDLSILFAPGTNGLIPFDGRPGYDFRYERSLSTRINADGSRGPLKYPFYDAAGVMIQGFSNSKTSLVLELLDNPEPLRFFTVQSSKPGCFIPNIPNIEPPPIPKERCCMACSEAPGIDYRLIKKIVTDTIKEQSYFLDVPVVTCSQNEEGLWEPKTSYKSLEFFAPSVEIARQQAEIHHENAQNAIELCLAKNATGVFDIIGGAEFPVTVPEYLTDKVPKKINIQNLTQLLIYTIKQLDALCGEFPIEIKVDDSNLLEEGEQPKTITLPNIAETLAECMGLLTTLRIESDANLSATIRALIEAGSAKQLALIAGDYAKGNAEYLGYKGTQINEKVPMAFTPGKERLDEVLKESEINVKTWENTDKYDINDAFTPLLEMAAMWKAQNFEVVNPRNTKSDLTTKLLGTAGLLDRLNQYKKAQKKNPDEPDDWSQFTEQVERGFTGESGISDTQNPYGRDFSQRPKIKDLGVQEDSE